MYLGIYLLLVIFNGDRFVNFRLLTPYSPFCGQQHAKAPSLYICPLFDMCAIFIFVTLILVHIRAK